MIAYRLEGEPDQATQNTNTGIPKDMRGIGVGAVTWRPAALVMEGKRVGAKANAW